MQRVCFVLAGQTGPAGGIQRSPRSVWPEMLKALRETGWNNYSLFSRIDGLLVGYLETEDFEQARAGMAGARSERALAAGNVGIFRAAGRPFTRPSHGTTGRNVSP